jgi:hydrogenase-4 component B
MAAVMYGLAALLGVAAAVAGVGGMLGTGWVWQPPWSLPLGGLAFGMDPLAGFFVALIGLLAVPAALAAYGEAHAPHRGLVAFNAFVAAMIAVPLAANALTFLLAWELMSLASYVLVVQRGEDREAVHAGWVYMVMTHAGLGCLLAGMLLLGAWTGSLGFADWHAAAPGLPPGARSAAFVLLAVGFGAKAGLVPLHIWLPLAHPAAPAPVSALMSGVMIKLGVYGLLRAGMDWLDGPPWWGVLLLLAGAATSVVGVLSAMVERDLKRLLAFSSIENAGIVVMGVAAAMIFHAAGLPPLAQLGVLAALYHTANHAAFKALLFLGAGAAVHATGTRDIEAMGGLARRMPWTAAGFLVGAAAIAGLPPLNGFVSEWLTFQALLQNLALAGPGLNLAFALAIAALALTGGLAVACFVRAFGITFLALPRTEAAAGAHEAPAAVRAAIVALAAACVVLGVGAPVVAPALARVARVLTGGEAPVVLAGYLTLDVSDGFATLSTPAVAAALLVTLAALVAGLRLAGAVARPRLYETWGCGRLVQTARMEYTGTAFANPFTRVFDFFYRPVKRLSVEAHPASRLYVRRIAYDNPTRPVFEEWLYRPVLDAVRRAAGLARLVQSGSATHYLAYIFAALIALLVLA